ncbi:PREDICTED: very-long-chain 3-oxoacyl-CoA reductase 1-like [Fragaria vesca subsp. vesca]|uniref:very-long-chain 3-oxoacyl-CoA reductase 1-like n=1 Tax=Fragaria vesca subsp. vesca TaxID=101020 RepID=UPI0002C32500|nr:PREDICTED: very-long-chain 3-oxoacyl-CoA reductase 1-like [Fragaria vesca subsp. vesca]
MELHEFFIVVAIAIGLVSVCKSLINCVRWVWVMFLRPPRDLKEYGSWAIITGSTDGIGKALAFEMASKGLNLVLVGRNPSKLEATSKGIRENCHEPVKVKSIVIDLAKVSGEQIAKTIEEGIKGLDVGILVNNAGVTYPYARFFHEVDLELMESITKVNMEAPTWVTRAVLPGMLKKKKGAIINIGSDLSEDPSLPLYTLYAASKSYLKIFSRCISLEYKEHGIDIQCQAPRFVATEMTSHLKSLPLLIASLEKFSKASIRWIGYDHLCNPYWSHSVQGFMIHACPDALVNALTFWMCSTLRNRGQMKETQ